MAEILRVSGIPVPVLAGEASHEPTAIGEVERAEDGTKLISRRAIKETFKVKVAHQSPTDGIAWKKLLMGEGQTWDFNTSLYGSKGLGPSAASGVSIDTGLKKFGAASMKMLGTSSISYPALPSGSPWTIMYWSSIGGAFTHVAQTSVSKALGYSWGDGVQVADPISFQTVSSGVLTMTFSAFPSSVYFDDLVILPFVAPSSWFLDTYNYGAAFSKLAKLNVDGDLIDPSGGSMTVCGDVKGVEVVPGYLNGTYYQSIRVLDVELEEG
jgi:hypothetical protein